ncbi:FMRFamide receptor [Orchesella cincta]|uniref:FMRFamide receptor n=1 Tax=Orchesella cincta TaxID=48709 RepID=A0A1D2N1H2_ORCCI|nr:FMRFamide receptor [Orchesella cincta]
MEADDYEVYEPNNTAPYWQNSSELVENFGIDINASDPFKGPLLNNVTTTIPFLPLGLAIILVTVFGIVGNLLSAIILSRKRLQSSYSVLTLGLTFVDSVYLITKFLRYGIASLFSHYETAILYLNVVLPIAGPYLRAITFTAHTASTYFTIAIAIDRFIAVCWPATARKFCTRKRALFTCVVVLVWSFVFNATRWLEFRTVSLEEAEGNVSEANNASSGYYVMKITELRTDPVYKEVYIFWIYLIMMFILPFVTLTVLNLCIFIGIRKLVKNGAVLTSTQKRDTSFAIMLIGVVLVFLICNVDYLILDILDYSGVAFSEFWNHLGNFLLTLNSAVNFLIYCVCGWKFRQELCKLMRATCPCLQHHGSHDIVVTDDCQWVKDTINMDVKSIPRATLTKTNVTN